MNTTFRLLLCILLLPILFSNVAWAEDNFDFLEDSFYEAEQEIVADPFESLNRVMFTVNDYSYIWVLEPLASGYSKLIPEDIRSAVANFFHNLQEPVRFVNTLLQLRFADAGTVLVRFAVNTVGGVGGLGDPAGRELGFKPVEAGLGETLTTWGIGDGFYLFLPLIGPTTLREFSGTMVDGLAMTPYYFWAAGWEEYLGIYTGKELNKLSLHLGKYEALKELSIDPYLAFRDGYFQRRKKARERSELLDDKI